MIFGFIDVKVVFSLLFDMFKSIIEFSKDVMTLFLSSMVFSISFILFCNLCLLFLYSLVYSSM
ncbi:hypothetical protein CHBEV_315 [Choristoneura biennis entomopoxvirus]|uniref:Uncharacterized protein n=1 Tax=Choristoneura biennis entomopoxvirus TaxID=10288 RepID=A0A916NXG2_CBEPV|nr:hypothetical protein CHBEV_020 [Choristoneura biennis entomopoxvirus]YP_008004385.1 hypothetical protein CHBEV_315 [Choristoneura biennis entomopoxvirus]CCU55588.1 hypothetical protein CHBEV_020 [Choristoneura biennis entomopoxvirus]CCU55883.1 hypothetical protein CHBEV_315 [Choristoneura biennis entomopoxvirus]